LVAFSLTSTTPPSHLLNLSSATLKRKQVFKLDFVSLFERELNVCQSTFCEILLFKSPLGDLGAFYFFLPLTGAPLAPFAAGCPGFGRLAPYFERRCVRPLTPAVSSVPRTT